MFGRYLGGASVRPSSVGICDSVTITAPLGSVDGSVIRDHSDRVATRCGRDDRDRIGINALIACITNHETFNRNHRNN